MTGPILDPCLGLALGEAEGHERPAQVMHAKLAPVHAGDEELFALDAGGAYVGAQLFCQLVILDAPSPARVWKTSVGPLLLTFRGEFKSGQIDSTGREIARLPIQIFVTVPVAGVTNVLGKSAQPWR